jgi:hypothetical protein
MNALVSNNITTPVFGFLSVRNHQTHVSFNKKYLVCQLRKGGREGHILKVCQKRVLKRIFIC